MFALNKQFSSYNCCGSYEIVYSFPSAGRHMPDGFGSKKGEYAW
jgi:hypothetical protein